MKHLFLLLLVGWLLPSATHAAVPLAKNDTLLFYGNSMVERLLEAGTLEAYLQLAHPDETSACAASSFRWPLVRRMASRHRAVTIWSGCACDSSSRRRPANSST